MKYIKDKILFESANDEKLIVDSIKPKIEDIFTGSDFKIRFGNCGWMRITGDDILIRMTIFKVVKTRTENRMDRFVVDDIKNELEELSKIGFDHIYTSYFVKIDGLLTSRYFDDLTDFAQYDGDQYTTNRIKNIDIYFLVNSKEIECSNPECDNIILSDQDNCSVCGEVK